MKNKNGFISMTLVYTFLIIFLFVMVSIITAYLDKNKFLNTINDKINMDISTTKNNKNIIINKILEDNTAIKYEHGSADMKGLYFFDDSAYLRRLYFYRGNVNNNFAIFGEGTSGKLCWRIIGSDENGNVKLIYAGVSSNDACSTQTGFVSFADGNDQVYYNNSGSANSLDNAYVGYYFGTRNSASFSTTHYGNNKSNAANHVLTWAYNENIINEANGTNNFLPGGNNKFLGLADTIYCSDRRLTSGTGVTASVTTYASKGRLSSNALPVLICDYNDTYSLSEGKGGFLNHKNNLSAPLALITADEARFAGITASSSDSYLKSKSGEEYWTMSPSSYSDNAYVYVINSSGALEERAVSEPGRIRPVITIKQTAIVVSGNGLKDMPYIIRGGN